MVSVEVVPTIATIRAHGVYKMDAQNIKIYIYTILIFWAMVSSACAGLTSYVCKQTVAKSLEVSFCARVFHSFQVLACFALFQVCINIFTLIYKFVIIIVLA